MRAYFSQRGIEDGGPKAPTIAEMRRCVIGLRTDGRLPDYRLLGNAGSFFQSPTVSEEELMVFTDQIQATLSPKWARELPEMRYETKDGVRMPAAQLLRACGLGDAREGGAALYAKNPTVMVNANGKASAAEVGL